VDQELDAHRLPGIRRHVEGLVLPDAIVRAQVHDRGQDVAARVGDIGILPVKRDRVGGQREVPVAEGAPGGRHGDLLIENTIAGRLAPAERAQQAREGARVRMRVVDGRVRVAAGRHPGGQAARLEAAVDDGIRAQAGRRRQRRGQGHRRRARGGRRGAGHRGRRRALVNDTAHHVNIFPGARAGVGPDAIDIVVGGGDVDIVACGEVIAARDADAQVAGRGADAYCGAPGGAIVRRLAVIDIENAGIRVVVVVVPDSVPGAGLVGDHPGLHLVGIGHRRRGQLGRGTPGRPVIGAARVVDHGFARAPVRPGDHRVAVGRVDAGRRDGVEPPDAAARVIGRARRRGERGNTLESAEAHAAISRAPVADRAAIVSDDDIPIGEDDRHRELVRVADGDHRRPGDPTVAGVIEVDHRAATEVHPGGVEAVIIGTAREVVDPGPLFVGVRVAAGQLDPGREGDPAVERARDLHAVVGAAAIRQRRHVALAVVTEGDHRVAGEGGGGRQQGELLVDPGHAAIRRGINPDLLGVGAGALVLRRRDDVQHIRRVDGNARLLLGAVRRLGIGIGPDIGPEVGDRQGLERRRRPRAWGGAVRRRGARLAAHRARLLEGQGRRRGAGSGHRGRGGLEQGRAQPQHATQQQRQHRDGYEVFPHS